MRISQSAVSRGQWFDRNISTLQINTQSTGVGPHTATVRNTYTVPAGRKAYVIAASVSQMRIAVATTASVAEARVDLGPNGSIFIPYAFVHWQDNAIGVQHVSSLGNTGVMVAGDAVRTVTSDLSNTGTCDFSVNAAINEFDA